MEGGLAYICMYVHVSVVGVRERRQQRLARDGKQCDNASNHRGSS